LTQDVAVADRKRTTADEVLARAMRHHGAGRLDEALAVLEELIAEHGELPKLRHYKGIVLVSLGQRETGEALIRAAQQDAPDDPVQLTDLGTILAEQGRMEEAVEIFREAVEKAPNYAIARSNLGAALVIEQKYVEAIEHLKEAVRLEPTLLDGYNNLSKALLSARREEEAIEMLFRALAVDPQSLAAHVALAEALFRAERHESAEHHAKRALEINPNLFEAYLRLGDIYGAMGRMDEAADACLIAARAPALSVQAVSKLVHLRKTTEDSPEFQLLSELLAQLERVPERGRATIHMAAGKAFEDLKRYPEAFDHFHKGNEITKDFVQYDSALQTERAQRLRAFVTPELIARCQSDVLREAQPIFVVGMPRSGTTLMDQMFSRHTAVQAGGEQRSMMRALGQSKDIQNVLEEKIADEEVTADGFAQLGEAYLAAARQNGLSYEVFTDKLPSNYLYSGLAALAMPRARFIFMRRHPFDCILSNYAQNFGDNQPASTDLLNLAEVYKEFDAMTRHVTALFPERAMEVHYENVVANAETQMRDVMAFCDLDWQDTILDHTASTRPVNTASVAQVREAIYSTSVAKWARYAAFLGPLAEALKDYISAEDYDFVQQAVAAKGT